MLKQYLPWRIQNWLVNRHRKKALHNAMNILINDPYKSLDKTSSLLDDLIYGWGNQAWSAERAYLEACIENALKTKGPILECGSGISTLILATIASKRQIPHIVLEDSPQWAQKIRANLQQFSLLNTKINDCPITMLDGFSWYDTTNVDMTSPYTLVICDGPPSSTPGGRYGLLPVMGSKLDKECIILLDDADRQEEHDIVEKWRLDRQLDVKVVGGVKPYFYIKLNIK